MSQLVRLMRALRRWERHEWSDLLQAQASLCRAQVLVWLRPSGDLVQRDLPSPTPGVDPQLLRRIELAFTRASTRGLFRPSCLVRAVAMQWTLTRLGVEGSRIRIGVRKAEGSFEAHAWVVHGETILGDDPARVRQFSEMTDVRLAGKP